jgi:hypothetical protein
MGGKNSTLIMMSRIDSRHWKISTGHHFQNGHHNTAKIQHCLISSKFYMWVDNDVPNWFPTFKISTGHHFQNGYHNTAKIQHCPISSKFDIWVDNDVPNWFPTLKKKITARHFQNGHHNTAQIQHCPISTPISYVGRLWCPELIPEIENFLPVSIFKMAATILQKFQR